LIADDAVNAVKETLRDYILREHLRGESPERLTNETALMTGGLLDSLGTIALISFIETHFRIEVQVGEASPDNFETIDRLASYIMRTKSVEDHGVNDT
jgi:acyl carrier protein